MTTDGISHELTGHQVFISYCSQESVSNTSDKRTAEMICSELESRNIRCWIAPRDILPGEEWLNSIFDAVEVSKIIVVVFSANTEGSDWVKDEIKFALDKKIKIIPFRIENVEPKGALRILKVRCQLMDAFTPPLEKHLNRLVEVVGQHLGLTGKIQRIQSGEQIIQKTDVVAGNNTRNKINLPVSNEIKVMPRKSIDYFDFSGVGRRPFNQDRALCAVSGKDASNRVILAVADGMVGLEAGEVASKTMYDQLVKMYMDGLPGDFQQTVGKVVICIQTANRVIYDWSQQKKGAQVGTTVSGAVVIGNRCLVFNVGNSRTYLIRAGGIQLVSKDHSADMEAYEAGYIKKEAIGKGLYSNALTRSVGTDPEVAVDIFSADHFFELKMGDTLFSCTDGLWNKVTDAEIKKVFDRNRNIQKNLQTLYKLAYKNGSTDNISMAAYRYGDIDAQPALDVIKIPAVLPAGDKALEKEEHEKKSEQNRILKRLLFMLIGVLAIVVFVIYLMNDTSPNNKKIPIPSEVTESMILGGAIQFEPDGGEFRDSIEVRLSITEPLKTSQGDVIDADIYYTLDGSEPTKEKGVSYTSGESIVIQNEGSYILRARLIARGGSYEGPIYSQTYIVQHSVESLQIIGGNIEFRKRGGNYIGSVEVPLAYKTLRFAHGKAIPAEIYFTINGDDPTRRNGTLYKDGAPIKLTREGKYTIKARVFSRDGKYKGAKVFFQTYTIQKTVQETVTVLGGKIRFTVPSGENRAAVRVVMEFESLRLVGRTGNVVDSEIYYTLDGSEPAKATGKRYKQGEILEFKQEGIYPVKARVISKDGKYMGMSYSQTYFIQYNAAGGAIGFTPGGGQYTNPVQVRLSIKEPLKKGNDIIAADIYYTLDGKDPVKASGKRCADGEIIGLTKEGDYTLKARVISRDGKYEGAVYSQAYTVKPPEIEEIKTADYTDLDKEALYNILERIQRIEISDKGVHSIESRETPSIDLFISSNGEVKVTEISYVTVEPRDMISEIKSRLAQKIKGKELLKPTNKEGKPINVKMRIKLEPITMFESEGRIVFKRY